jgi:hypothetical protein
MQSNEIMPTRRYIPVRLAFEQVGIGRTRGYEMIKENLIRAVKLGRKTYIDWHSVERLFESLPEIVPKTQMKLLAPGDLGFVDREPESLPVISLSEADLAALE